MSETSVSSDRECKTSVSPDCLCRADCDSNPAFIINPYSHYTMNYYSMQPQLKIPFELGLHAVIHNQYHNIDYKVP